MGEPFHAPTPTDPSWDLATSAQLLRSAVAGPVLADLADATTASSS